MATAQMNHRPTYGRYERPSSAKLAGVKFGLYHPALPTLRKMSMDGITRKLPTEHSRTTTTYDRDNFMNARTTLRKRGWSEPNLSCKSTLSKETNTMLNTSQHLRTTSYTDNWKAILETLHNSQNQSHKQKQVATQTDTLQLNISGLATRTTHPGITGSWQNYRPNSAQYSRPMTPKQLPATMYSRYRGERPFSANPWK